MHLFINFIIISDQICSLCEVVHVFVHLRKLGEKASPSLYLR